MKGHFTLLRSSEMEPHYQMQFSVIPKIFWGWYYPSAKETVKVFYAPPREVISFWWLVGFYGISNFVGYLMPNPILYKKSVLFQFGLTWVHNLIVKNICISSYLIYSNSSNSAYLVKYKHRSSIQNNYV